MAYSVFADETFIVGEDTVLTKELLSKLIGKHRQLITRRYNVLNKTYNSDHDILRQKNKAEGKPDNRIVVNFAKYIVDTFNGFFIGIPIKITSEDKEVSNYINFLDSYNDQDDNNAELARITSIFGKGYEMYFLDEDKNVCITYLNPLEGFMIYDNSVLQRPLFFVTWSKDEKIIDSKKRSFFHGHVYDKQYKIPFSFENDKVFAEEEKELHGFQDVPFTEYIENEIRHSAFEDVFSMINAYNKAISEKANDVDYFSDAYLKVLGAKLGDSFTRDAKDKRIINFHGHEAEKVIVEFMEKPSGDVTQENLINRLERLIYQLSMVANINDENFGTASGIAIRYKLQSMLNLFKTKERKFVSGMNRRYKVIFGSPTVPLGVDDWLKIEYTFTPNFPANLLEEAQIAAQLSGIVSKETQLKALSIVDNVKEEVEAIEKDLDPTNVELEYDMNRV